MKRSWSKRSESHYVQSRLVGGEQSRHMSFAILGCCLPCPVNIWF